MKDKNNNRLTITMPENISRLLTLEAARQGKSKSSIVIEAMTSYFKRPIASTKSGIQFNENSPTEQFTILNDRLEAVYSMLSGVYRSTAYVAQLQSQTSDSECKRIARKKAMNDYSKMKLNQLTREEFLIETMDLEDPITPPTQPEVIVSPQDTHEEANTAPKEDKAKFVFKI